MIDPRVRDSRRHRPLTIALAMVVGMVLLVITLRLIKHGYAFGQWMAELSR